MIPGASASVPVDTVTAGHTVRMIQGTRLMPVAQVSAGPSDRSKAVLIVIIDIHSIPPDKMQPGSPACDVRCIICILSGCYTDHLTALITLGKFAFGSPAYFRKITVQQLCLFAEDHSLTALLILRKIQAGAISYKQAASKLDQIGKLGQKALHSVVFKVDLQHLIPFVDQDSRNPANTELLVYHLVTGLVVHSCGLAWF